MASEVFSCNFSSLAFSSFYFPLSRDILETWSFRRSVLLRDKLNPQQCFQEHGTPVSV